MTAAILRMSALTLRYPHARRAALDGIDLQMQPGDSLAVVGPNGAGKSTLLLALNGTLRGEGEIVVDGLRLAKKNLRQIRQRVGLIFQNPDDQLFMPTVRDDVAFGLQYLGLDANALAQRVQQTLQQVGLSGFEDRAPHHLSGGEKRAVALAGVLAMRPPLVAMDEPTSGLDPRGRRTLRALLKQHLSTYIVASHDLEFVLATCTRCMLLDAGRQIAAGDTREILADAELMDAHGLEVPASLR